MQEIVTDILG